MKYKLPANAFPALELSPEARQELVTEGQQVIAETRRAADTFAMGGKNVPKQQWKLLRRKENVRVYRDRRRARKQLQQLGSKLPGNSVHQRHSGGSGRAGSVDYNAGDGFTPELPELDPVITSENPYEYFYSPRGASEASSSTGGGADRDRDEDSTPTSGNNSKPSPYSSTSSDTLLRALKPTEVPVVMAEGTIEGTIEDCMLGSFAGDESKLGTRRLEASYLRGKFDDMRTLLVLDPPTLGSPLQFSSIKWLLKDQPVVLNSVAARRDHIVLEMAGISTDSSGRKFGYRLLHSVVVPGARELSNLGMIRGFISFCVITRVSPTSTPNQQSVDVYCRGYSDARGGLPAGIATMVAADCVLAVTTLMNCALSKKLAWLAARNRAQPKPLMRSTSRGSNIVGDSNACAFCGRSNAKIPLISSTETIACRVCNEVRLFYRYHPVVD